MHKVLWLLLALLTAGSCASPPGRQAGAEAALSYQDFVFPQARQGDLDLATRHRLEALVDRWIYATQVQAVELLLEAYWPDAEKSTRVWTEDGGFQESLFSGIEEIEAHQRELAQTHMDRIEYRLRRARPAEMPTCVCCYQTLDATTASSEDRLDVCHVFQFQERGGDWRIIEQRVTTRPASPEAPLVEAALEGDRERAFFMAEKGSIVRPETVNEETFIASMDYGYPWPQGAIGVTAATGHHQLSVQGQEEILHIGVQARSVPFDELPPMNLAVVIDGGGSMAGPDELESVKAAFDVLMGSLRAKDFVSLVVFSEEAVVAASHVRIGEAGERERLTGIVGSLEPGKASNILAGLKAGYEQVLADFDAGYNNRLILLSDGIGETVGALGLADVYREKGVGTSTYGFGSQYGARFMRDLAMRGEGSARFISTREVMERCFGAELDRTMAPIAFDLTLDVRFSVELKYLQTWGYGYAVSRSGVHYRIPAVHSRDSETLLVQVMTAPRALPGECVLAAITGRYRDVWGNVVTLDPQEVEVTFVDQPAPLVGFSDARALLSGTALHLAQTVKYIGSIVHMPEHALTQQNVEKALVRALDMRRELGNTEERLDVKAFDDELRLLEKYVRILGESLGYSSSRIQALVDDEQIAPPVAGRKLGEHIGYLFHEIGLHFDPDERPTLAVAGFTMPGGEENGLTQLLNQLAASSILEHGKCDLVERDRLDAVLAEQDMALSDLANAGAAVRVGELLAARYILVGKVIEMADTGIIFGRIINTETAEIESVAQVVVPKDRDFLSLLRKAS